MDTRRVFQQAWNQYIKIYIYVYKEKGKRERRDMKKECAAMSVTENCSDRIETRSHPVHFENNLL